ncbi:MAG: hypothetical protein CVT67_05740 [Actinobacteria bacterium HGW-Actinobacteria-7]|nr:MAG: hypothetical protein CVT67_05740 [Actinobacteria bacterium HGW-Actinobacteria-7]
MAAVTGLRRFMPPALIALGLAAAAGFTLSFPAIKGLGNKVRLPVFHGALTWVNLAAFTVLALVALAYLVTRRDGVYRWAEGFRWTAVPLWIVGSGLGLIAALQTWDFTGSKSSPMSVAAADPRLMAQAWIMLAGMALIALGFLVEERLWLAVGDVVFVAVAWTVLMKAVLGPGRALHPDSPVLNSDEPIIKLLFFGIVASLGVAAISTAWWIKVVREGAPGGVVDSANEPPTA